MNDEKQKPAIDKSDAEEARRFRAILAEPEGYKHMLSLLQQGKGNEDDFRRMLDRIEASRANAKQRIAEGEKP